MKAPIVLIIYNRSYLTKKIIDVLRNIKPKTIYVIADGPKDDTDFGKCRQARNEVEKIDWNCTIHKRYSKINNGLRRNMVNGLDWVFKSVDRAIILEDDLTIDESFFKFCDELLEKYKDSDEIISISGNNFQFGKTKIKESYYFSKYVHSWGWATWRRGWKLYDDSMKDWLVISKDKSFQNYFQNIFSVMYWKQIFKLVYQGEINSWAYIWSYTAFKNQKLTIIPKVNLVSNTGYGKQATHTFFKIRTMGMKTEKINFPLKHPNNIVENKKADLVTERNVYMNPFVVLSLLAKSMFGNL